MTFDPLDVSERVFEPQAVEDESEALPLELAAENGAALLEALAVFIRRYVVLSEPQAVAAALWTLHTHTFEAAETTPYLSITSAEKRSGKSRLLEALALLAARPLRAAGVTEAALFRSIAVRRPTLLMDEVDAIFGPKVGSNHEDLRALLNAGYQRGTPVLRCVGDGSKQTVVEFAVFCPKALAGIGYLPGTIADRAIPVRLKRRMSGEQVERFRRREAEAEARPLQEACATFGEENVDALALARPELPEELDDRAADGWEPLFAIAELAGVEWSERARRAALVLAEVRGDEDDSLGIRLLADVRRVFADTDAERMSTADLLAALAADEEAPWADWRGKQLTPRGLARFLGDFGVHSGTVRLADGTTAKGYKLESFEDPWKRYVPQDVRSIRHNVTTRMDSGLAPLFETSQADRVTGTKTATNPHEQTDVTDVTDVNGNLGAGTEETALGRVSQSPVFGADEDEIDRLARGAQALTHEQRAAVKVEIDHRRREQFVRQDAEQAEQDARLFKDEP